jgi:uncharacterized protein DUF955
LATDAFKGEVEMRALEMRAEMKLAPQARLMPLDLAEHLGVPVRPMRGLPEPDDEGGMSIRDAITLLTGASRDTFSAMTVIEGHRRLIVFNESHHENRRASSICHELAHILLEHVPGPATDQYGHRFWDAEIEDQAARLAAALLVPREGARIVLESGRTEAQAAKHFGVSLQLFQWRARETGVVKRVKEGGRNADEGVPPT